MSLVLFTLLLHSSVCLLSSSLIRSPSFAIFPFLSLVPCCPLSIAPASIATVHFILSQETVFRWLWVLPFFSSVLLSSGLGRLAEEGAWWPSSNSDMRSCALIRAFCASWNSPVMECSRLTDSLTLPSVKQRSP